MSDKIQIEQLIKKHGFSDFKWLDPEEIVVSHWVRMKCRYGCEEYGMKASCPPNVPTIKECRKFFNEYKKAVIFHFAVILEDKDERHEWCTDINLKLLELEKDVFCGGDEKAFVIFVGSCSFCSECSPVREGCKKPRESRPSPEGLGVDVFSTARKIGYPVEVLSDYSQEMNRYGILLIR